MNHRPNQPISSETGKTKRPSLQSGVEQSDSKEMLFLAAGLITLTLGLGGLFMYSDDETLPVPHLKRPPLHLSCWSNYPYLCLSTGSP